MKRVLELVGWKLKSRAGCTVKFHYGKRGLLRKFLTFSFKESLNNHDGNIYGAKIHLFMLWLI